MVVGLQPGVVGSQEAAPAEKVAGSSTQAEGSLPLQVVGLQQAAAVGKVVDVQQAAVEKVAGSSPQEVVELQQAAAAEKVAEGLPQKVVEMQPVDKLLSYLRVLKHLQHSRALQITMADNCSPKRSSSLSCDLTHNLD